MIREPSLAAVAFLFLALAVIATAMLAGSTRQARRHDERLGAAFDRERRSTFVDLSAASGLTKADPEAMLPLPARVFGYDPARRDLYAAPPPLVIAFCLAIAFAIVGLLTMVVGRFALPLALPLWPFVARLAFRRWHERRSRKLFDQFPDALAMIVRGVRIGIPVGDAIATVAREGQAPTAGEFARVAEQLQVGLSLDETLQEMAQRNDVPEYRFFATALNLQGQTGGNLSDTLEGLADVIRRRIAARDRGFALAAEARTSANVLTGLPIVLFFVLWMVNPHYIMVLVAKSSGHVVLGGTLGLLFLGTASMRMMIRKSLS